jgi:hypothetical protein
VASIFLGSILVNMKWACLERVVANKIQGAISRWLYSTVVVFDFTICILNYFGTLSVINSRTMSLFLLLFSTIGRSFAGYSPNHMVEIYAS